MLRRNGRRNEKKQTHRFSINYTLKITLRHGSNAACLISIQCQYCHLPTSLCSSCQLLSSLQWTYYKLHPVFQSN